jgi:precorrin-6B methylase 2
MPTLTRDVVLHHAPDLPLLLHSSGEISVTVNGLTERYGPHTLAILEVFSRPIAFGEALEMLRPRVKGAQDLMELTSTIVRLRDAGVLAADTDDAPAFGSTGFSRVKLQKQMLNDRLRVSRYLAAIQEVVRPGDVVVEIGTGTGILATAAAKAGARKVYAIEAGGVASVARAMFEANGVADRVTLVRGWSNQVSLPERADVLVSEIIGDHPFEEGVLEFTADAVKRMLKPGARLLPSTVRVYGLPVSVPAKILARRRVSSATARKWTDWYGLDFSAVARAKRPAVVESYVKSAETQRWPALADPVQLAELSLASTAGTMIDTVVPAQATSAGALSGVIVYFELDLGPGTVLSTSPALVTAFNSWHHAVWTFDQPLRLQAGDNFAVRFRFRTGDHGLSVERR